MLYPADVDFYGLEFNVSEVSGLDGAKPGENNSGADDLPTRELSVFEENARGSEAPRNIGLIGRAN